MLLGPRSCSDSLLNDTVAVPLASATNCGMSPTWWCGPSHAPCGWWVGLKWLPALLKSGLEQSPNSCTWNAACELGARPVTVPVTLVMPRTSENCSEPCTGDCGLGCGTPPAAALS